MSTKIYWITKTIGIMPRPRGNEWLEDEIIAFKKQGASVIVSLLEQHEITELGLRQEKQLCEKHAIQFIHFPIPDRSLPAQSRQTEEFIHTLSQLKTKVLIHCRMGIGRSTIIAASLLLFHQQKAIEIISHISHIRGLKVPDTAEQFQWLKNREELLHKPVHHFIQRQPLHNHREDYDDITGG
ncbi:phosphatase domain-containing putative toxin [Chitinophaga silvisoli]|uniref:Protein tyrosine phosphatase n=1 Tax=Chitinophaga silvisoli TaxID=2291814 RepID=A0A3E1P9T4_9BACT|nr:dual specificity protein phosphatase family protein [Chitinophaga silvisoli]RFM36788.1 protein tyrosine phosphatase [Chitinophaga silvisoli]